MSLTTNPPCSPAAEAIRRMEAGAEIDTRVRDLLFPSLLVVPFYSSNAGDMMEAVQALCSSDMAAQVQFTRLPDGWACVFWTEHSRFAGRATAPTIELAACRAMVITVLSAKGEL
jgi:hypothetical protein